MFLQLCELTFNKTRHLRNPYNENLPVKVCSLSLQIIRVQRDKMFLECESSSARSNCDVVFAATHIYEEDYSTSF
jgi:hypothetical protein